MYVSQRRGEQTSKLVSVIYAQDAKIMEVLKGSGKEKFIEWSCYDWSFLESEEIL